MDNIKLNILPINQKSDTNYVSLVLNKKNVVKIKQYMGNRKISDDMVNKLFKLCENLSFDYNLTVLTLAHINDEYYIIDGQHRFEAFKKYVNEYDKEITINLCIKEVKTHSEIEELYMKMTCYLPHFASDITGDKESKNIVHSIIQYLKEKHVEALFVQNKLNVKRPGINENELNRVLTNKVNGLKLSNFKDCYEKFLIAKKGSRLIYNNSEKNKELAELRGNMCAFSCVTGCSYSKLLKDILKFSV